ncbi:MAG: SusC/RagA family TonB-linked outer membrane protein [Cyclobacteriaceae bacterium]
MKNKLLLLFRKIIMYSFYGFITQILIGTAILAAEVSVAQKNTSVKETHISFNFSAKNLETVFREIEEKTNFTFVYTAKEIDQRVKLDGQYNNAPLYEVLLDISKKTNLAFRQYNQNITVKKLTTHEPNNDNVSVQVLRDVEISGKITDENGEGLPGASVVVKGSSTGTTTDLDGMYKLSVPEESTIVVSFVGYKTNEILVGTQSVIDVRMQLDAEQLDEVVVIGYGTSKKSEITGSVGIVTREDLSSQPSVNPLQNLRGKIAGVTVFSNSGEPGGNNRVLIRGMGTINASSAPLYVVDGMQVDNIDYLNPSDIVSMEVLKDASSAAIYGARGANGVVLITTQGGLDKKGIAVEYKFNLSFGTLAKKKNPLYNALNAEEFMEVQRISFENATYYRDYTPGDEPTLVLDNDLLFDAAGNPLYDTNWEKEVTRTAVSQDHHLSIRSAGENSSTGIFLNYTEQQGVIRTSELKRMDVKLSNDATLSKWLSVGSIFRVNHIWESKPQVEGSGVDAIARGLIEMPSIYPVRWPDGTYADSRSTEGTTLDFFAYPNPVAMLEEVENLFDRTNIQGNVFVDVSITPDLTFRSQVGVVNRLVKNRYYAPVGILGPGHPNGYSRIGNSDSRFWQNENFLTYDKTIGENHFKAVLGASWQGATFDESTISVRGFTNDFFKYNNVGVAEIPSPPSSNYTDWAMNSYFFRGNYTFKNKYTATLTGRVDGSSRFGNNNKYAFFPSGGVSWSVSEEDFMTDVDFINMLRLRASYGFTGNSEIGSYSSLATVSSGTNMIGGALRSTSSITRLANPDLQWEKSRQLNLGFNLRAFNNVLAIEADYYYKLTTDLLLDRPVPSTSGFTSITDNIGSLSNRGIDLLISTTNVESEKFSWNTSLSLNYNKNKVEALGENDEDIFPGPFWVGGSQTILRVGEPVSSFWGQVRLGTYGTDEVAAATEAGKLPGMVKRTDEKQIIGSGLPDYRGSFINRFSFGRFDAIVDMQFSLGAEVLQQFVTTAEDRQGQISAFKTVLYNSWTPDNQNTPITRIRHSGFSGQDLAVDSHWVANGSYLRGNLISIGYSLNNEKLKVSNMRVYASIENAFVIYSDDFKGYDPESNGQWDDSNFGQNIFFYSYPKARTFSLGLSVQF